MSDIHYERAHDLGLDRARELAREWLDDAARKLGLSCQTQAGETQDTITFERTGVKGTMLVSGTGFTLDIKLGMMMAAFKPLVEAEVSRNLERIIEKASGGSSAA